MTSQTPPTDPPRKGTVRAPSLLLINTGDGKGKSTAAFGTVMRAVARGWKVAVIQFLKSGGLEGRGGKGRQADRSRLVGDG